MSLVDIKNLRNATSETFFIRRNVDPKKLRNATSGSLASFLIGTHCVYRN